MKGWGWVLISGLAAAPTLASDNDDRERLLQQFFEGRLVTVLADMPATHKGVDVRVDREVPIDAATVGERIAQAGVAIHQGTRVAITKVHLKDDLIEFHLAGGGFNWVWDTQAKVSPETGKSRRERELEKEIKDEKDPDRRRELEHRLRDARRDREREEHHRREIAATENALRDQQDRERALFKGSRFNLRWDDKVPVRAQTPQAVMAILAPWVDFSGLPGAPETPRRPRRAEDDPAPGQDVRTGMSWSEVQDRLGPPDRLDNTLEGDLRRSRATYGERGLELTFVNEVLVQIRRLEDR